MAITNEEDYYILIYLKAIALIEDIEPTIDKGEILNLRSEAFKALLDEEKKKDLLNPGNPNLASKIKIPI
jgi:hypothetical protein